MPLPVTYPWIQRCNPPSPTPRDVRGFSGNFASWTMYHADLSSDWANQSGNGTSNSSEVRGDTLSASAVPPPPAFLLRYPTQGILGPIGCGFTILQWRERHCLVLLSSQCYDIIRQNRILGYNSCYTVENAAECEVDGYIPYLQLYYCWMGDSYSSLASFLTVCMWFTVLYCYDCQVTSLLFFLDSSCGSLFSL